MDDIRSKNALITGASRGIGRAIALAFAEAGVNVAINYRDRGDAAAQVAREAATFGAAAIAVQADVSQQAGVAHMIQQVEHDLGPIDILVNNAGIARVQRVEEVTEADWDELITVNLKSCFLVSQAVIPGMRLRKWGRLIHLSSVAAQLGGMVGCHYAASKAGIIGLSHSYANQLVKEGITSNAIAPALIETEMVTANLNAKPERIPTGRFGHVDEIASIALMLAANGFMTGQTISPNGGLYMT